MAQKKMIKARSAGKEDARDMFYAICEDILKKNPEKVRSEMKLQHGKLVQMEDVVTLCKNNNIEIHVAAFYVEGEHQKTVVDAAAVESEKTQKEKDLHEDLDLDL